MSAHTGKVISAVRRKWELLLVCAIAVVAIVGGVVAEANRETPTDSTQYVYTPEFDSSLWGLDQ